MTGEELKRELMWQPAESFELMTFGELKDDDMFISMPMPGDNSGHGGFRGPFFIFKKIEPLIGDTGQEVNCVRLKDDTPSNVPDTANVIQVILA